MSRIYNKAWPKNNQAKYTYGAFIFICSFEKYLTADGKLPLANC